MAKKCRVYRKGSLTMGYGGMNPYKKETGGEPAMTQDSNPDPVFQEKRNNFLKFLKDTSSTALMQQQLELEKQNIKRIAQGGYEIQKTDIPEHLEGSRRLAPGAITENYGKLDDPNKMLWLADYYRNQSDWRTPLKTIGTGAMNVFSQPDVYEFKGDPQHDIFGDYIEEGYKYPSLDSFEVDSVTGKGRHRTLNYTATGTQEYAGVPKEIKPFTPYTESSSSNTGPNPNLGPIGDPNDSSTTTHGYMNKISQINKIAKEKTDEQFINIPGVGNVPKKSDIQKFVERNQGLFSMFQYGGSPYGSFPGYDIYNSEMFGSMYGSDPNMVGQGDPNQSINNIGDPHGYTDFLRDLNTDVSQSTGTAPAEFDPLNPADYETNTPGDRDISSTGSIDLVRKNKFKQAFEKNPYLLTQSSIAGMQLLGNIGNIDENLDRERQVRERVSNVHRIYGAQGSDRGDYMANVPGVGDFLKPDEHVRKGFDTKVAQDGVSISMEEGAEYELTDQQIRDLVAQGYDLEYLD